MLPACRTTIAGPSLCASAAASASGRIRPCASTGTTSGSPETEEPQRQVDGRMPLGAHEHAHRRPARQTASDVVAGPRQHRVARGCEAGEVGHRRAGHEADRALARQPEQVEHPPPGDLLDRRRGRGQRPQAGVLVPGRGQPVGAQGRRQRAADHHPEEAAGRDRDQPRLARRGQQVDHVRGRGRSVREVAEAADDLVGVDRRRHGAVVERGEPGLRMMVCPRQCRPSCLHPPILAGRVLRVDNPGPASHVTLA